MDDTGYIKEIPWQELPSPAYVLHSGLLRRNLEILTRVSSEADVRILLALKGFAAFCSFPLINQYLQGTTASSLHEALLGRREFGGEVHVYAPAYTEADMHELVQIADHLLFNSETQWQLHRQTALEADIRCGLRINPEYSEVEVELYNPCRPGSRFGIRKPQLEKMDLQGISGLHFHTLCEQNADTLERTLRVVEDTFGDILGRMKWINMGGGHHITRSDYDVDRLIRILRDFKSRYDLEVYLEPGEAVALNTGFLVCTVLDIIENNGFTAILDTSATAHMPDVLEMPYRPVIIGADLPGKKKHTYRLGGLTCLAGDVIGAYSFDQKLKPGDRLVFTDMAHYTMVKNTTFNGILLPSIVWYDADLKQAETVRTFGYEDYRNRLS